MQKSIKRYCEACGAELIWVETTTKRSNTKLIPCDYEPVPYRKTYKSILGAKELLIRESNDHHRYVLAPCTIANDAAAADGYGYMPHAYTCPKKEE